MLNTAFIATLFKRLQFKEKEMPKDLDARAAWAKIHAVIVQGVNATYGFSRIRLVNQRPTIEALLEQLPAALDTGCPYTELCYDRQGSQWTTRQRLLEQLVCLGLAIGALEFCEPREQWLTHPDQPPQVRRVRPPLIGGPPCF